MAVGALTRVSSLGQDLSSQRLAIEKAAAARGDRIDHWYEGKQSGKSLARPELESLRADVRAGILTRAYCFKLDRITRSGVADTYRVVDEIRKAGCELIAVADNLHIKPGSDDLASEPVVVVAMSTAGLAPTASAREQAASSSASPTPGSRSSSSASLPNSVSH